MLSVVGLSHRTAPLEVRERIAFTQGELKDALAALKEDLGPGVVLSTCNRTEVYSIAAGPAGHRDKAARFFGRHRSVDDKELARCLYAYEHEEAVRHLFRVVSGLDSLVLGESQILRQVREAFSVSVSCAQVNGALSRLFHQSFSVGKRVRRETEIGRNALSVSHAGVELARKALGDLRESRVMVVGAGEAGKLVAHALCKKGVGRIVVVNRTPQRAQELASQLGGEAASFDQMQALLSCVDIVVSATDAQGVVLPLALMKQVMAARGPVPLVLVDIAVPRDVDPQVANLDNVSLFDLDDLTCVSQAGRMEREKEVARVEEIIGQETAKFMEWWTSLEVVPVIAALREQAEALRRRELAKTLKTMPHLPKQEVERIEALSEALVSKLLHHPIAAIRGMKSQAHVHLTRELFCLDDKGPEAGGGHHEAGDAASQHRRE